VAVPHARASEAAEGHAGEGGAGLEEVRVRTEEDLWTGRQVINRDARDRSIERTLVIIAPELVPATKTLSGSAPYRATASFVADTIPCESPPPPCVSVAEVCTSQHPLHN
jgi:hypothetical protein